jgi:hypothetical protein
MSMSDRQVAQNHPAQCCAYGCPMLGTMSKSTTGGKQDWICRHHFDADGGAWQTVTNELRRVHWLVEAIQTLRANWRQPTWDNAKAHAKTLLVGAQRSDLLPNKEKDKTQYEWMFRLENELHTLVKVERHHENKQAEIEGQGFRRVAFAEAE